MFLNFLAGEAVIMSLREAGFRFKVQVNQQSPDHLQINYLDSDEISNELKNDFQNRINQLLGASVTITYNAVAELTYDNSGKYRYVTSQCN